MKYFCEVSLGHKEGFENVCGKHTWMGNEMQVRHRVSHGLQYFCFADEDTCQNTQDTFCKHFLPFWGGNRARTRCRRLSCYCEYLFLWNTLARMYLWRISLWKWREMSSLLQQDQFTIPSNINNCNTNFPWTEVDWSCGQRSGVNMFGEIMWMVWKIDLPVFQEQLTMDKEKLTCARWCQGLQFGPYSSDNFGFLQLFGEKNPKLWQK